MIKENQEEALEDFIVIRRDVRATIYAEIFAQNIITFEKAILSPGKYIMTLATKEGVKYLGIIKESRFIGQSLAKWQMHVQGDMGKPKISIVRFKSLLSTSTI